MDNQIAIDIAQAKKEEVLENLIEAHRVMGLEDGIDLKKYVYLSKNLLKLVDKVFKKRNYVFQVKE